MPKSKFMTKIYGGNKESKELEDELTEKISKNIEKDDNQSEYLPHIDDNDIDVLYDRLIQLDYKHTNYSGSKREYVFNMLLLIENLLNQNRLIGSGIDDDDIDFLLRDNIDITDEERDEIVDALETIMTLKVKRELLDEKIKRNEILTADEQMFKRRNISDEIKEIKTNIIQQYPELKEKSLELFIKAFTPDIKTRKRSEEIEVNRKGQPVRIANLMSIAPGLEGMTLQQALNSIEKFQDVASGLNVIADAINVGKNAPESRAIQLLKYPLSIYDGNPDDNGNVDNIEKWKQSVPDRQQLVIDIRQSYDNTKNLRDFDNTNKQGNYSELFFNKVLLDKYVKSKGNKLYEKNKEDIQKDKNPVSTLMKNITPEGYLRIDNNYNGISIEQKSSIGTEIYSDFNKIKEMKNNKERIFILHSLPSDYVSKSDKGNIAPNEICEFDINKFLDILANDNTEYKDNNGIINRQKLLSLSKDNKYQLPDNSKTADIISRLMKTKEFKKNYGILPYSQDKGYPLFRVDIKNENIRKNGILKTIYKNGKIEAGL